MVLKLYGNPISTCTKCAVVVLKEKNVPFKFIAIYFSKGEHKAPDFVAKQPFGQVPLLIRSHLLILFPDDDGFILYECRAIWRYIATKYASQGPALIPLGDLEKNALFEQAASSEQANFEPAQVIYYEKFYKKMIGQETDEAVVAENKAKLGGNLDVYEVILSKQAYVAGNVCLLYSYPGLPGPRPPPGEGEH
ncbi:thioredoxin-like protein [Athelia psychrophila]|uniref:glutathione transferase n=1 Tax=Athelia psychrophila TaxID=1759441 RepID=A0A166HLU2_9AGAM|nr:thioredoxin-like protein [Fibularhizoctonia sp. CBS 109695]